jgi:hypothetical protein
MNNSNSVLGAFFGAQKIWVNWKLKNGTKVPYQLNLTDTASSTNPLTWSTYEDVIKVSSNVGIILTDGKLLLVIDIDHCIVDGKIVHPDFLAIERLLAEMNTYVEISPSGTGLHLYIVLTAPLDLTDTGNKKAPYELYTSKRYITVTNDQYRDYGELRTMTPEEALNLLTVVGYPWKKKEIVANVFRKSVTTALQDHEILTRMFASKTGDKIKSLYEGDISAYGNDDSSADMALCSYLAFWTAKDADQIERIWMTSPLGLRQKTQERKDYRDRTIKMAIDSCTEVYSQAVNVDELFSGNSAPQSEKEDNKRVSQSDLLLKIIDEQKDIVLFHDERRNPYVQIGIGSHTEIWPCDGEEMKSWLTYEFWKKYKKGSGAEALTTVLGIIAGRARFEGNKHLLGNRMAWKDGELWYDLANENWQAVRVTNKGWSVNEDTIPILFRRYNHHSAQVLPSIQGNAKLILDYVNITNKQHRLLVLVYMISCFIPDFPHALLIIYGSQGSAKTTFSKLMRSIIDPSLLETLSLPKSVEELIQLLHHHAFMFVDNVSGFSTEFSDTFCKAVSGGGFSKRKLYTDEGDIIYSFKRCIALNGINIPATRPDLLERSMLIELERIEPSSRKEEGELVKKFKEDLPVIMGGIFDVLVKALELKPTIKLSSHPRMADFAIWGCAIAEALGYSQEEFLTAYSENISQHNELVMNENIVGRAMIEFMKDKNEWTGTATELLKELDTLGFLEGMDSYERFWPKSSNSFTRKLNELRVNLKEVGIIYTNTAKNLTREISLKKVMPLEDQNPANNPLPFKVEDTVENGTTV